MSELIYRPIFLYHQCYACEKELPEGYKFKTCGISCKIRMGTMMPKCLFCRSEIPDMHKSRKWFCDYRCSTYHRELRIQLFGK